MKISGLIVTLALLSLLSCKNLRERYVDKEYKIIVADAETSPVSDPDDAADDPAIWIHPDDPSKSLLVCSNKKNGIVVYDLSGKEVAEYPVGKINNVDIRQGIYLNDTVQVDIAAGSNRNDNTITVMAILKDGSLVDIAAEKIQSNFSEVYGFCLYHDRQNRKTYAFVNDKNGMVEQWHLSGTDELKLSGTLVRTFRAAQGQLEGCVADDELGILYIGEEDYGIWRFDADPAVSVEGILVDDLSNPALKSDIEGLTIFYGDEGKGFLIASSQGNNSYAVYRREGDNTYLGSFTIGDGDGIDGVTDTDGIDVISQGLGPAFPNGLFIAQDGYNHDGDQLVNQNFKLVGWEKIEEALKLD